MGSGICISDKLPGGADLEPTPVSPRERAQPALDSASSAFSRITEMLVLEVGCFAPSPPG